MYAYNETKPSQDRAENRSPEAITITHFLSIFQKVYIGHVLTTLEIFKLRCLKNVTLLFFKRFV